jgi:hypothetical protein
MRVFLFLSIYVCEQKKQTQLNWAGSAQKQFYLSGRVSFSLGGGCQFWVSS